MMLFASFDTPPAFIDALWSGYAAALSSRADRPLDYAAFTEAMVSPASEFLDTRQGDGEASDAQAALRFFGHIAEVVQVVPASWFDLFLDAHRTGAISAVVWGVAARVIYTCMSPKLRGKQSEHYLAGFRLAGSAGLMTQTERADLVRLPAQVTLYRGAIANDLHEAISGLNWTPFRQDAQLGILRRQYGWYGPRTSPGHEYVLEAKVDRSAILAVIHRSCGTPGKEDYGAYIVDFERIDPRAVRSLGVSNLSAGIVLGGLANIHRRLATL